MYRFFDIIEKKEKEDEPKMINALLKAAALLLTACLLHTGTARIYAKLEAQTGENNAPTALADRRTVHGPAKPAQPHFAGKELTLPTDQPTEPTALPTEPTALPEEPTEASDIRVEWTSAAGFLVEQVNGVTYVGGVLVANKTFSLPEDYYPGGLTAETEEAFSRLRDAAAADGYNIYCLSGFRSYSTQSQLYSYYCSRDGATAADTYSARPGHSEHQSGLALDVNSLEQDFAETPEGQWLAAHCAEYGFIIRYPADKESVTGYMYEPWHIRYVGEYISKHLALSGQCLEEYLGIDSAYKDD